MNSRGLDATDRHILAVLQRDGRISNQDLADQVSLSPSPCLRRIRRLEQLGFIRHYAAVIDPARVGVSLLAYVNVKLEKAASDSGGQSKAQQFTRLVEAWPEVIACYAMTGDLDYLLRVQVPDLDDFSRFMMDTLLAAPGVLDVRSSFALRTIKEGAALPIP
ncbi:MAG: Lrp/AsnC family transcriptional regulator [Burkholderiaceae bacterium]